VTTRGRPRNFDLDEVLDRAIEVFWRHGYEGTTLDALTTSMGISRPSLYAAFVSKQEIFKQAVRRYADVDMAYVVDALAEPTARGVAERYLRSNVVAITTAGRPPGCLSIQGGLSGSSEDQHIVDFLNESRRAGEELIADRFRRSIVDGELSESDDPHELAKFLSTASAGLAVQAAAGASRGELMAVAERMLRAFP
jgi:AcrR family transcriptional regulator